MNSRSQALAAMAAIVSIAAISHGVATSDWARGARWVWLVEHVGFLLVFGVAFGRTLQSGRVALITRIARRMNPALPPEIARYTRTVTVAWTVFFAAMIAISVAVYAYAPFAVWSTFANFGTPVLVGAMFAAEVIVQRLRYPQHVHPSIADCVRAFAQRDRPAAGDAA